LIGFIVPARFGASVDHLIIYDVVMPDASLQADIVSNVVGCLGRSGGVLLLS
jgi:hypothetical protein